MGGGDDLGVPGIDLGDEDADAPRPDLGEPDPDLGVVDPDLGVIERDAGPPPPCEAAACAGHFCAGGGCGYARSCSELLAAGGSPPDSTYMIDGDGPGGLGPANTYCDMTLDGGGWTLVLKANGGAGTFAYGAALWTDTTELGDSPNLDAVEAKLRAYVNVGFTQMRVVLMTAAEARAIVLDVGAPSCVTLFGGSYRQTKLPRDSWLAMVPDVSLQDNCGQQGINVAPQSDQVRVRIGIVGNNENNCNSTNSRIGVGGAGENDGVTVGNVARWNGWGGDRDTVSFGYVFVR